MRLARTLIGTLTFATLVLILSTCELSKVLSNPKLRTIALSFQADSTVVLSSGLRPEVRVTIDGEAIIDPEIRFTSSDTSVIAVSASGDSLIARRLGRATINAVLHGALLPDPLPSASDTVYVVPKTFTLDRTSAVLTALGETLQLQATATDALDRAIPNLGVVWSSSDTSVATVSPTGVVTARTKSSAPVRISARLDGIAATADITITQRLARFVFQPSGIAFDAIGAQTSVAVSGQDRNGIAMAVPAAVMWASGNASVATVHPSTGAIISVDNGSTFIRASVVDGDLTISDTVHVDVNQQATRIIISSLSGFDIPAIGGKLQLTARAFDRLDAEMKKPISWTSLDGNVAGVDGGGFVTGRAVGNARIQARVDAATAIATVVVQNLPATVVISPKTAVVTSVGDALQLAATVSNAVGATIPDAAIAWSTPDGLLVSVSTTGLLTTTGVGVARAIATSGGRADTAIVTISNAPDQVDILPTDATLASVNDSLIPVVTVTNARGAPLSASSLLWATDDAAVARVTATGTIIATGSGATFIKASSPTNSTRRDSILITVTNAPASLVLSDNRDTLTAIGRTRTYVATVRNARGTRLSDATVSWQSTVRTVASVSEGTVTAEGVGTTLVIARSGAVGDTVELTVTNDAISIDLQPPTLEILSVYDTVRLAVTVRNDLGIVTASTPVWSSTVPGVATVDASGNVASQAIGMTRIIATAGALADTSVVTVTNNPATIVIAPDTVRLASLGDSIVLAATLTNSRGAALPRTAATWSSDDPTIARVSSSGTITARDTGTTTVRATSGSVTDAVVVVVTNAPARLVLDATIDTLTAPGQQITYTASVVNLAARPIDPPAVTWQSTNGTVATVSGTAAEGHMTAVGIGSTLIIARSGLVADTIALVVRNPTRLYVDNGVFVTPRTGSVSRPYFRIQDAVNASDPFDTVIVRKGASAYSETVALAKRIVLLGDSTGFNRIAPNPSVLPLISHDTGSAAITAITGSPQVIRFLAIRHTTDGAAVDARGPDIRISHLYVNDGEPSRIGRGITIDNTSTGAFASVDHARVTEVRGFGIRFVGVTNGLIRSISVSGVDSISGTLGAGIEATDASGIIVDSATVRLTGGAQVHLRNLSSATLSHANLAGRHQLVRASLLSGNTQFFENSFDLQLRGDEPFSDGSLGDGRSGVSIAASRDVLVRDNVFVDQTAGAMDGIRITGSRGSGVIGSTSVGAQLLRNRFTGGRYQVRSSLSTWTSEGSRYTGAVKSVFTENTDTLSLRLDTLGTVTTGCVDVTGNGSAAAVVRTQLEFCAGTLAGTMQPALRVAGTNSSLVVDSTLIQGPNTIAVEHGGGGTLSVMRSTMLANGTRSLAIAGTGSVIGSSAASSVIVHRNRIQGYSDLAAVHVPAGSVADVDSNQFSRNKVGVRAAATAAVTAVENDWFGNDSAGVAFAGTVASLLDGNFWGDVRGPKRAADLTATGDSALGSPTPTLFRAIPLYPGTIATELRVVRGYVGSAASGDHPLTVRVVDASGFPVSGVQVVFSCSGCGTAGNIPHLNPATGFTTSGTVTTRTVTTKESGLAEVSIDLRGNVGTLIISAAMQSNSAIGANLTVIGQ